MRIPVKSYYLVCDSCSDVFENYSGNICYTDEPNEIESDAYDSGWLITLDNHHYCPDCWIWNYDTNKHETKDGKYYDEEYEPVL